MEKNIGSAATTDLSGTETLYSVGARQTDAATGAEETEYMITKATQWLGYYKTIPELKKAIDTYATWVLGKGYVADPETQVILENITGWGEDTFNSIMWNALVCKKIYGDAFIEIIRDSDSGELINLKPLDPAVIKIIADEKGIIKRYEQVGKTPQTKGKIIQTFKPDEILHLCNDRVADEIHGVSVIEACQWVIDARNEALADQRKVNHRNVVPVRIIEVDTDDQTKISDLKVKYQDAVNKGEVLIIPKGTVSIASSEIRLQDSLPWIMYLENFFYQAVGVPKTIVGATQQATEANSKVGMVVFDPIYIREITELQMDLWNQLYLKIQWIKQQSLMDNLLADQSKDTGQLGMKS